MRTQSAVLLLLLGSASALTLDKRSYNLVQQGSTIRMRMHNGNGQRDWGDVAALSDSGEYAQETMSAVQEQNVHAESISVAQFEAKQAEQDKKDKVERDQQLAELKRQHDEQEQEKTMGQSLVTMQKELASAKEAKKEEDSKHFYAPVFDHKASSLIQAATGTVLVQHEKPVEKVLTAAGKSKNEELQSINPDLSKDDQKQAREDIDDKYKGQNLAEEQPKPKTTEHDKKIAAILASANSEDEIKAKIAEIDEQAKQGSASHGQVDKKDLNIEDKSSGDAQGFDLSMSQTNVDLHLKSMTTDQMKIYNDMSENIKQFSSKLDASLYDKALEQRQALADQGIPSSDIPMLHVETLELFSKGFQFAQTAKNDFATEKLNQLTAAEDNLNNNPGNHILVQKLVDVGHSVAKALKGQYSDNWTNPLE